jgi:hypothetical protein
MRLNYRIEVSLEKDYFGANLTNKLNLDPLPPGSRRHRAGYRGLCCRVRRLPELFVVTQHKSSCIRRMIGL